MTGNRLLVSIAATLLVLSSTSARAIDCVNGLAFAHDSQKYDRGENIVGDSDNGGTDYADHIARIVHDILRNVGRSRDIAVYITSEVQTACAGYDYQKSKAVWVNSDWLKSYSHGDYWVEAGVLAHEIGHHINDDKAGFNNDNWRSEIEADTFLGTQLKLLGGSLENAKSAVEEQSVRGTHSHPPVSIRRAAVEDGYGEERKVIATTSADLAVSSEAWAQQQEKPREEAQGWVQAGRDEYGLGVGEVVYPGTEPVEMHEIPSLAGEFQGEFESGAVGRILSKATSPKGEVWFFVEIEIDPADQIDPRDVRGGARGSWTQEFWGDQR